MSVGPGRNLVRRPRRGAVLAPFVLLVVACLALIALVADVGLARLTRRQLQTATDAAAWETLRFRDGYPPLPLLVDLLDDPGACADPNDVATVLDCHAVESGLTVGAPGFRDYLRRKAGQRIVAQEFPDERFGAGPLIDFDGGVALDGTDFRASERLSVPDAPRYVPRPQRNAENDATGDLVAGTFADNPAFSGTNRAVDETADYERRDFLPASTADAPAATAVLARLRRTGETLDPQHGTSGPRLPWLFGRGSLLGLDARARGIAVRAQSIADARPAMTVGVPRAADRLPGSLPFALRRTAWETVLTADVPATLRVAGDGRIEHVGAVVTSVGYALSADGQSALHTLGQQLATTAPTNAASFRDAAVSLAAEWPDGGRFGYVPIVSESATDADRVIGFGWLEFSADMTASDVWDARPRAARLAPENASAVPASAVSGSTLLPEHRQLLRPLLAPAIVR